MSNLTKDQQSIFDNVLSCIEDAVIDAPYCTRIVAINGPAGSGKSYLSSKMIEYLQTKYKVTVTATTHKALSVLREMLRLPDTVPTRTIHSHLQLKIQADFNTGAQILVQNKRENNNSNRTDVLFIDESSMVSNELFVHIKTAIERRLVKIIVFTGDKMQLLPVEGNQNPIYAEKFQYDLTEVVRQAAGNPIIQLATVLRKCIESNTFYSKQELIQIFNQYHDNDKIVVCKNRNDFFGHFFAEQHKEKHKFICVFTNKAAEAYNITCRMIIKGQDIPNYIPGDEVVFNEMHMELDMPVHVNNEIVTIQECELQEMYECPGVQYWKCKDEAGRSFQIIDRQSANEWQKFLSAKAFEAKQEKEYSIRNSMWKEYFSLKESIQSISFTYAGTTHKAQGSSYDITYVDVAEIFDAWRYQEDDFIYRLLYVACTRPKETLVLKLS